jgi:hypothetical protein
MQVFIIAGIIMFAGLFFLMSLPIQEDWAQIDADSQTPDTAHK